MPIGPNGEKRPVGTVQNARKMVQILSGEVNEEYEKGKPDLRAKRAMQTFDAEDPASVEAFAADTE